MKTKLIFLPFFLFVISAAEAAAPTEAIQSFRKEKLQYFSEWFTSAELSGRGNLQLNSNEVFPGLEMEVQQKVMGRVISVWLKTLGIDFNENKSMVEVSEPGGGSLWAMNLGYAELVERWQTASPLVSRAMPDEKGPWFLYVGGIMSTTENDFGASVGFRIGTYLLDNKIDTSLSLNVNYSWIYYVSDSLTSTYGLMARYHFPIADKITCNIGGLVNSDSFSAVTGIGIHFPSGIFDISLNLSDTPGILVGWNTFF